MKYLSNIFTYLLFAAIVAFAGYQLWKGIGKGSETRRYHGKFVFIGSMIGFGVPAVCLFPLLIADLNASIELRYSSMVPKVTVLA